MRPAILKQKIGRDAFIDSILKPHTCYYKAVKGLFGERGLHGMAHITGAGIEGNLSRILPKAQDAQIDLAALKVLPIFQTIRDAGEIRDAEMLKMYNMGVGLTLVTSRASAKQIQAHMKKLGHNCYPIGEIIRGTGRVRFEGKVRWANA